MGIRRTIAIFFVGIVALIGGSQSTEADPILGVLDIRPIRSLHPDIGNALGLTYNAIDDVLYLADGSDPRGGFIYTLGLDGSLLHELNFQAVYQPGAYPASLSYDRSTGHLFVLAFVPAGVGSGLPTSWR
jgi:hypothetical protein